MKKLNEDEFQEYLKNSDSLVGALMRFAEARDNLIDALGIKTFLIKLLTFIERGLGLKK